VALSLLAMTSRHAFAPAARGARAVRKTFAPKNEGAGNAGCPLHPQPRVQCVGSTRVSSPRSHRNTRHSRTRVVLTAYFALSPEIGLSCLRRPRIWRVKTRSGRHASADLTPASRRQDHTTSPSALAPFVCAPCDRSRVKPALRSHRARERCRVHRIPPRVRDDRDTPLCGVRRPGL
jgi:hypothetical protein